MGPAGAQPQRPAGPSDWFPPCANGPVCPADAMATRRLAEAGHSRDSEEGFEAWALRRRRSLWQAPPPGGEACWEQLQKGSLPTAGVNREGNGCLSAAFARTPPKPSCRVCRTLRRQLGFPNLLEKQAGRAGHVLQANCCPVSQRSFTLRLRNSPKWRSSRQERSSTVACFWKYLALLQRYF